MKSCPTCNRTFEDTFTFCLVDGSILSAPFDPEATQQLPASRNTDPPPTEVMSPAPNSNSLPPTQGAIEAIDVPPTIASPIPKTLPKQEVSQLPLVVQKTNRLLRYVGLVIGVSIMIVLTYAGLHWYQRGMNSPAATARAFNEAIKNKDVAGFKRTINEADLKVREGVAFSRNMSVDEYLKQELASMKWAGDIQETRNEVISGEKATVEVKINGEWQTWVFVKENGEWKRVISFMEELFH